MYKKRHIVLTAVITALVVFIISRYFFFHLPSLFGYASDDAISRARALIEGNYVDSLNEEQRTRMTDMAISGMVYGLGDQYSRYLSKEDLEEYKETKEEVYKGIGVNVFFDAETETMTVVSPYDGSPAQKAGIIPGDVIRKVGNMTVSNDTYNDVLEYIQKGESDDIFMVIERGEKSLEVTVHREEIKRQSVTYQMLGNRVGYIRIAEFIHSTKEDFAAAISSLQEQKMNALVIDLRNNPGGYADSVLQMTDTLLPEGVIAYLEDNKGNRRYFNSDEAALDLPMAVLINQGTASASELMAGSLQAHGLATIIGEKSYGKAVGQTLYPLTAETALYLTDARYFTPKGECIDKKGIEPDITVQMEEELMMQKFVLEPETDAQLKKALEVLAAQVKQ